MSDLKESPHFSREHVLIDVFRFIHEYIGVPKDEVSENTVLQKDLGLEGDDAGEFMVAYSEKFCVDLENFNFAEHFDVEGGFNPIYFVYLLLIKPGRLKKKNITVANLVDAAIAHKWS